MSRARAQEVQALSSKRSSPSKQSVPADVVGYLRAEKGMTLQQIATLTGTTESFISRVGRGQRNLTVEHLYKLEAHLKESLPLLLLRAMPRESLPEQLQPLFDQAVELLKALGASRFTFSVPPAAATEAKPARRKPAKKVARAVQL